jgi:diguanylate cyclase (GGDEF)-like protein/PAS domain S-box-containing protein
MCTVNQHTEWHPAFSLLTELGVAVIQFRLSLDGMFRVIGINEAAAELEAVSVEAAIGAHAGSLSTLSKDNATVAMMHEVLGDASLRQLARRNVERDGFQEVREYWVCPVGDRTVWLVSRESASLGTTAASTESAWHYVFRAVFNAVDEAVFIHRPDGTVVAANRQVSTLYGVDAEEALTLSIARDLSSSGAPTAELPQRWERVIAGEAQHFEWRARRPRSGEVFPVEVHLTRMDIPGNPLILATVRDLTNRKAQEQQLRLFKKVVDNAIEGIVVTDATGKILSVNRGFTRITGYEPEEAVGGNPRILKSQHHDAHFYEGMWRSLGEKGEWTGEIWNRRKSGESYPQRMSISAIPTELGEPEYYVSVFHDITEVKRHEEEMRHLALHDPLTGLPNRSLFHDRLGLALRHAQRHNGSLAVVFFDLDRFKDVNDSLGHAIGDELLRELARRVSAFVRGEDTFARISGDEFVILMEDSTVSKSIRVAERIISALEAPFALAEQELYVSASIGIASFPRDGQDADTLMKNADFAMYRAKESGRGGVHVYTAAVDAMVASRIELESALRKAVEEEALSVSYQPRFRTDRTGVAGAEALVRWNRNGIETRAEDFIGVAEESGLVLRIDQWVLRHATAEMARLLPDLSNEFRLSINLSQRFLEQPDFASCIEATCGEVGFPLDRLEIEIAAQCVASAASRGRPQFEHLSRSGVRVAVDNFGNGNSSLLIFKALPIHVLHMDRTLIADIPGDEVSCEIGAMVTTMARKLRLTVVAEGVESATQVGVLRDWGCDLLQGFYFSESVSGAELASMTDAP